MRKRKSSRSRPRRARQELQRRARASSKTSARREKGPFGSAGKPAEPAAAPASAGALSASASAGQPADAPEVEEGSRRYWEARGTQCQIPVRPSHDGTADDGSSRCRAVKCPTARAATCTTELAAERQA
eukprot:6925335-Pyramimonas_sp.AAC.1